MATILTVGKRSADDHGKALAWVATARNTDKARYGMGGILFVSHNDMVRAVATDGRRLHLATLPREYVSSLDVEICDNSDHTTWHATNVRKLTNSELVLGDADTHGYPDYERVIPRYTMRAVLPDRATSSTWLHADIVCALQDSGTVVPRLNANYVSDVCSYEYAPDIVQFKHAQIADSARDRDKPIVLSRAIDGDDRVAVIMPAQRIL